MAFEVTRADLLAHDRRPTLTRPRQIAMYLARELTTTSLPAIGREFGGRNHSTVLHAHRKVTSEAVRDPSLMRTLVELKRELTARS